MSVRWLSLVWGVGEAIFFFFVPDIVLTRQSLLDRRFRIDLLVLALAGALAGAAVSFALIHVVGDPYAEFLDLIPAITADMIADAREAVATGGLWAVVAGSFQGVPYKLYSHAAFHEGVSLWIFLLWSIPARGIRFALLMLVSAAIGRGWGNASRARLSYIHLGVWVTFYIFYFFCVPR